MKVKDLINKLECFDQDYELYITCDDKVRLIDDITTVGGQTEDAKEFEMPFVGIVCNANNMTIALVEVVEGTDKYLILQEAVKN